MARIRTPVEELHIGMYVAELDRPWLETPFLFQGFPIRTEAELAQLRACCRYVFVDADIAAPAADEAEETPPPAAPPGHRFETRQLNRPAAAAKAPPHDMVRYVSVLKDAAGVYQGAKHYMRRLLDDVRLGEAIDVEGARSVAVQMADNIVRDENALLWFTLLKKRDEYTSQHSLNVCVMALLFGRHLGLEGQELRDLGFAALLHDVGKMRVPMEVLNKSEPLSAAEMALMHEHPRHGYDILSGTPGVPAEVTEVAHSHHERVDGSGYPRGLSGAQISRNALIVAVVDVYDAVTSDRVYHLGISPHEALNLMYGETHRSFPPDLLEAFIRCLGIFPVGSLIELSTGEVAVVMTVNRAERLHPVVSLLLDRDKQPYRQHRLLDLHAMHAMHAAGQAVQIKRILKSKAYGIDLHALFQG
jgi:HD-GYP domain-containing protein (c-di-GMP phosphodiesterase class II)